MTTTVLILTILALVAYDVWTIMSHGIDTSISYTVTTLSHKWPIIAFALGFLMGHFYG